MLRFLTIVVVAVHMSAATPIRGAEPAVIGDAQLDRWIADLAADDFAAREEALGSLHDLATEAATAARVIDALAAAAARHPDDLELRETLADFRRKYGGDTTRAPTGQLSKAEFIALVDAAGSPSFARREAARDGLSRLARNAATAPVVMNYLLEAAADKRPGIDVAKRLEATWQEAWSTWIVSPLGAQLLPPVTDAAIESAVDRLAAERVAANRPADADAPVEAVARRELLFYLARPDVEPRVLKSLESRLSTTVAGSPARERLREIYDWSKPAMVAEYWEQGSHKGVQHLLIDVPNQPVGAARASHFDRCDERTAHCVSGSHLTEGNYPVGVYIPHPAHAQGDAQFHLVYLPTARRRLAYDVEVPSDASPLRREELDRARAKQITARTCRRWLEEKRELTTRERDMLFHIDAEEVSKFAGPYLQTVDDRRLPHESPSSFGNGSSHGDFCYRIAMIGTAAAVPGLIKAIEAKRVLEPVDETPYRMDWLSLLMLGDRVGTPQLDDWLASHVRDTDPISLADPDAADVGASAAALLLRRHRRPYAEFHLQQHSFDELIDLENPGFRFTNRQGRDAVSAWWAREKAAKSQQIEP